MDKQREAFEAWFKQEYPNHSNGYLEWDVGADEYVLGYMQFALEAWQAAQQAQWQPIETAPKEELRDLIVFNGKVQHGEYWEGRWIDSCHDWMNPQPTHWMPLPPEPQL